VGAWLFLGSETFTNQPHHGRFIETCAPAVAAGLRTLQQSQPGLLRRSAQRMGRAVPLLHGKGVWVVVALLAAVFFIPMNYMVSVECEIHPAMRRFVAAPFAGEFTKSLVKPGDLSRTFGHTTSRGCLQPALAREKAARPEWRSARSDFGFRASFGLRPSGFGFHCLHDGSNRRLTFERLAFALLFVTGNQAVADAKDAAGMFGHVFLVRHHNNGVALLGEFRK